jgi:hypothetical protein
MSTGKSTFTAGAAAATGAAAALTTGTAAAFTTGGATGGTPAVALTFGLIGETCTSGSNASISMSAGGAVGAAAGFAVGIEMFASN